MHKKWHDAPLLRRFSPESRGPGIYEASRGDAETQREANGQKMVGQKDNSLSVLDLFGDHVGPFRVRRGGSWFFEAEYCRSACRPRLDPSFRFDDCGFRVALSSPSGIPGSP
jgi:formylglycine-generating enzyme required for sulfatase activity